MHPTLRLVVVSKKEVAFVLVVLIVTIVVVIFVVIVVFVVVVVVIVILLLDDAVVLIEMPPPLPRRHPATNPFSARNASNHKQTIVCEVKIISRDNMRQTTSNVRGRLNRGREGWQRRCNGLHFP